MKRRSLPKPDCDQWWFQTAEIAKMLNGHRESIKLKEIQIIDERLPSWLLGLGILKDSLHRGYVRFFTELTKIYFASCYILSRMEEEGERVGIMELNYLTKEFKEKLNPLIRDLSFKLETIGGNP